MGGNSEVVSRTIYKIIRGFQRRKQELYIFFLFLKSSLDLKTICAGTESIGKI
jgi:hypothetical protein